MVALGLPRQGQHFERSTQIYIEAAFLGLAVKRRSAVDYGIRCMYEAVVFIAIQTETWCREISAEDAHPCLQILVELGKGQMELEGAPKTHLRILGIARAHQQIQGSAIPLQ